MPTEVEFQHALALRKDALSIFLFVFLTQLFLLLLLHILIFFYNNPSEIV